MTAAQPPVARPATRRPLSMEGKVVLGLVALAVIVGLVVALAGRGSDSVQAWCGSRVHVGDYLSALNMPSDHLVSVSGGVWTYDDGVRIDFIDGQVYTKAC